MVSSLNVKVPARAAGYEQVQYMAKRHTLTAADVPVIKIGTLPAGAVILSVGVAKITTYSGGTPVLGFGTVAANVGGSGDIATGMSISLSSNTVPLAIGFPLASDTDVWFGSSGAATTGDSVVSVSFMLPIA